ncbi:MAG TPA: hypothetical protein VGI10_15270 [Polyangiaceae bacterium]
MKSSNYPRSSAPLLALLLATSGACASRRPYYPVAPHVADDSNVHAELTELVRREFLRVVIEVDGHAGTSLRRVLLAPASGEPCREGLREHTLEVDGKSIWLRPIEIAGHHLLEVWYPGGAEDLLRQTPVLDLVLETAQGQSCLRLPISSDLPALAWSRDFNWSLGGGVRAAFPERPVGSVAAGWSADFGIGRYWGPLRTRFELGLGVANCSGHCPPPSDGSEGFSLIPLRFELDGYIFQTQGFGLATGLGFQEQWASRRNPDGGGRTEVNRGPRGSLRFDFSPLAPAGFPSDPKQGATGLEFSFGRWASTSGPDSAWVFGIGLVSAVGF